jgi:hypothetical protein
MKDKPTRTIKIRKDRIEVTLTIQPPTIEAVAEAAVVLGKDTIEMLEYNSKLGAE